MSMYAERFGEAVGRALAAGYGVQIEREDRTGVRASDEASDRRARMYVRVNVPNRWAAEGFSLPGRWFNIKPRGGRVIEELYEAALYIEAAIELADELEELAPEPTDDR